MPMNYYTINRLFYFHRMMQLIDNVDGDVVECGVGNVNTMLTIAALVRMEGQLRKIWGFDFFESFPEPTIHDQSVRAKKKSDWSHTTIDLVIEKLREGGLDGQFLHSQLSLIKGFFEESVPKYRGGVSALLHFDVDLCESYKTCLSALYERVASRGVVLFDGYLGTRDHAKFPGAAKAINEFFTPEQIQRDSLTGRFYHIKP